MYENTMANSANMNGVYLMARFKESATKLSQTSSVLEGYVYKGILM